MNSVIDECESTNTLARELGSKGAPHGTWISAHKQTRGRGRQGHAWESLEGNLFLSMVVRVEPVKHWTWIPIAAAVGITEELRDRLAVPMRIKWPNDLWIGDSKVGGILCEGVSDSQNAFVVIGVGINCAQSPRGMTPPAISLSAAIGREIDADEVRPWIVEALDRPIQVLQEGGPESIAERYSRWALFTRGARVTWAGGTLRGVVQGLGSAGELLVATSDGQVARLSAEDVQAVRQIK